MLAAEKLEIAPEVLEVEDAEKKENRQAPKRKAVLKRKSKSPFLKPAIVAIIGVFFISGLYFCSLAVGLASKGYELNRLQKEISQLAATNERIGFEIARMDSLDRIEYLALTELGMKKPQPEDYLLLASEKGWDKIREDHSLETVGEEALVADKESFLAERTASFLTLVLEKGKSIR